jgi:hypothetical protein
LRKLTVGLSWDKALDKTAKSIDNKDIGEIKHISQEYIQVEKGLMTKDIYFIPKYYVEGYDGDDIIFSLTENEIKEKFVNHPNQSDSILIDENYKKRKETVSSMHPEFEKDIPQVSASKGDITNAGNTGEGAKMSWNEVMDKEVKTSDNQELGKIKSIGQYFIEVEDGVISKKHYFVPKKYLQQYDGDKVYSSLTIDEIKQKYQRDSPPLESELEEAEKGKNYELIPLMAKEPGLEIKTPSMNEELKIPWEEIIHKHVRTTDNVDFGDVDRVGNQFIIVREGVVKIHLYYIPKKYIIKYDGSTLWLNLSSTIAASKFERDNEPSEEEMNSLLNQ